MEVQKAKASFPVAKYTQFIVLSKYLVFYYKR